MYLVRIALSSPGFPALQATASFFSLMKRNKNQGLSNICCKASINLDLQSQAVRKLLLDESVCNTSGIAFLQRCLKAPAKDLLAFTAKSSDARLHSFVALFKPRDGQYFLLELNR